jgi:hypothetical protein
MAQFDPCKPVSSDPRHPGCGLARHLSARFLQGHSKLWLIRHGRQITMAVVAGLRIAIAVIGQRLSQPDGFEMQAQ